jgi:hypothetical protein
MAIRRSTVLILAVLLLIVGCSPGTFVKLAPGFDRASAAQATLGVVILKDEFIIGNPQDVEFCLGAGDPATIAHDFLTGNIVPALKKHCTFKNITLLQEPGGAWFTREQRRGAQADDVWTVAVPTSSAIGPDSVRYVLIVNTVGFNQNDRMTGFRAGNVSSSSTATTLDVRATFVVWDRLKGAEAASGRLVTETISNSRIISKSTWFSMIDDLCREFAKNTPYGKTVTEYGR